MAREASPTSRRSRPLQPSSRHARRPGRPARLGSAARRPAAGVRATIAETAAEAEAKLALDLDLLAIERRRSAGRSPGQAGRLAATILMRPEGGGPGRGLRAHEHGLEVAGSLELSIAPVRIERLLPTLSRRPQRGHPRSALSGEPAGYQVSVRAQSPRSRPSCSKARHDRPRGEPGGRADALQLTLSLPSGSCSARPA